MPRKARYQREKTNREIDRVKASPPRNVRKAKTPEEKEKKTVKALARVYTEEALEQLAKIMRKSKYPGLQLQAIEQILNRGWGKPVNSLAGADGDGPVEINISEIKRTIVDPVADDEDFDQERGDRADMATIKKRVKALTTRH